MKDLRKYLQAALLPFIFLWYIGCIGLTPHTHIVDGSTIVHSHPGSAAGHEHGSDEETLGIQLISHFDRDLCLDGIILPMVSVLQLTCEPAEYSMPYVPAVSDLPCGLRAPPRFS